MIQRNNNKKDKTENYKMKKSTDSKIERNKKISN